MGNCIVTKLDVNYSGDNPEKFGCIKLNMDGGSTKKLQVQYKTADPSHVVRVLTEGEQFWDSDNPDTRVGLGREIVINDKSVHDLYIANPCVVEANDKYNLGLWQSQGGASVNVSDFAYSQIRSVWAASVLLKSRGNIEDLISDPYVTLINIALMDNISGNGGDILTLVRGWVNNGRTSAENIVCIVPSFVTIDNGPIPVDNRRMNLKWKDGVLEVYTQDPPRELVATYVI